MVGCLAIMSAKFSHRLSGSMSRNMLTCRHSKGWKNPHLLLGPLCPACESRIEERDPTLLDEIEAWHAMKDALLLRAYISAKPQHKQKYYKMTAERLAEWWRSLPPVYRRLMLLFLENKHGVRTSGVIGVLGCPRNLLRNAFFSLACGLRAQGLRPSTVLKREEQCSNGKRDSLFWLSAEACELLPLAIQFADELA